MKSGIRRSATYLIPQGVEVQRLAQGSLQGETISGPVGERLELAVGAEAHDRHPIALFHELEIRHQPFEDEVAIALEGHQIVDEDEIVDRRSRLGGRPRAPNLGCTFRRVDNLVEELDRDSLGVDGDSEVLRSQPVDAVAATVGDDRLEIEQSDFDHGREVIARLAPFLSCQGGGEERQAQRK